MKYIDTHAHLTKEYFKEEVEKNIQSAFKEDVYKICIPGTTIKDSMGSFAQFKKVENIYVGIGVHPSDASEENYQNFPNDKVKEFDFIGETGIDLYRDSNPSLDIQKKLFKHHLDLGLKFNKTVVVHARESFKEVMDILSDHKYKNLSFVMHSFTGDIEWAQKFIELGAYISFSGIVTFKNAKELQEVAKTIPLNRIICETDSPFLTPTPHRGKQNKPEYVKHVVEYIAQLRHEKHEEVIKTIRENSLKAFNI